MKVGEVGVLSIEELSKRLQEAQKEIFNLRIKLSTRQLVNHREVPKVRKTIAQIKTVLREKQLSAVRGKVIGQEAQS